MVGDVVQILSLVAVVLTLYFASIQTKRLRDQVSLANLYSRYEALNHASERYEVGLGLLFQRPDLRPYLFERKKVDLHGEELARALTLADLLAGAVDYAVRVGARFPDDPRSNWTGIAEEMAKQPIFQAIVQEQPHHFPDLVQFFADPATRRPRDEGRPRPRES